MLKEEVVQKLKRYCAYQERSHHEVRRKLLSLKIYGEMLEDVIVLLVQEDFLNEERFARSYARGKYRIKKWGRRKIKEGLKQKGVSEYCIKKALTEIDPDLYEDHLRELLSKYYNNRRDKYERHILYTKTIEYALSKGYEYELVKERMKSV